MAPLVLPVLRLPVPRNYGQGHIDDVTFGPGASSTGASWDQFTVNMELFGVHTSFNEDVTHLYDQIGQDECRAVDAVSDVMHTRWQSLESLRCRSPPLPTHSLGCMSSFAVPLVCCTRSPQPLVHCAPSFTAPPSLRPATHSPRHHSPRLRAPRLPRPSFAAPLFHRVLEDGGVQGEEI